MSDLYFQRNEIDIIPDKGGHPEIGVMHTGENLNVFRLGDALFNEENDERSAEEGHAVEKAEIERAGEPEVDRHNVV